MIEKIVLAVVLSLSVYLTSIGRTPNRGIVSEELNPQAETELVALDRSK